MLDTATTIESVNDGRADVVSTPGAAGGGGRWPRRIGLVGIVSLAVPVVAVVFVALTRTWLPPSDHALIQIRTMDVGGPLTPLLGSYSRLGWNHPGPLEFWLLALPYRLFGGSTQGMLVGATVINTVAIVGCLMVARRRGGAVLTLIVALGLAALLRGFGAAFLFHIWNPDLPALPTAFLVLATWSVIEGDVRLLPAVIAVSCFTWQTHIGYLPVTGGLAAVAVVAAAVHLWRGRGGSDRSSGPEPIDRPWVIVGASVVAGLVCLAPLIVEQLTVPPGNLQMIVNSFRHPEGELAGMDRALRVAAKNLAPTGTWITGDAPAEPFTAAAAGDRVVWLLLPLLAVLGAAVAAWRYRATDALRFLAVTTFAAALAVVAVSRTTGAPYNYLFNWLRPVGALLWVSVAWALYRVLSQASWVQRIDRPVVRIATAVLIAVATAALSLSSLANGAALAFQEDEPAIELRALVPGTLDAVAGQPIVHLRSVGGWCAGELGQGLALQMIEHGTEVTVVDELAPRFGRERVRPDVTPTVELFCGPVAKDVIAKSPVAPAATHNILTDAEELELKELQDGFRRRLLETGRDRYLALVDTPSFAAVIAVELSDVGFAPRDVDRFGVLLTKSQRSSSVFFRPSGITPPP